MSPTREKFPLSPKKFWKKMLMQMPGYLALSLLLGFFVFLPAFIFLADNGLFIPIIIGLAAFLFIWFLLLGVYAWYQKVYIAKYYYDISEDFVIIRKGVFAPTEIHVQYQKIQDVYVDQDIMDRLMGLYDVHLASATVASGIEAHIDGVEFEAAEGLKNLLLKKIKGHHGDDESKVAKEKEITINLKEEISSDQYPIEASWLFLSVLSQFFVSVIITFFVAGAFFDEDSIGQFTSDFSFLWVAVAIFLISFVSGVVIKIIWRHNYRFEFKPDYIFLHTGVISRQEKHVPYGTIQDVSVSQGIIGRLLGLADVVIQNASVTAVSGKDGLHLPSGVTIPGQTLSNAKKIAEIIRGVILKHSSKGTGL